MQETLKKLRDSLIPIYGKGETEAIIRIIFHYLKGWSLTDMLIHSDEELSPYIIKEIDRILDRLLNFEPIQYITGEARFHGMEFMVTPDVLIPRPETDELVDLIIDEYKDIEDLSVLDICSGSGCIAISLARNLPFSDVDGVEISPAAITVAEENSKRLKTKVKFIEEDIFAWRTSKKYDIIVSNPPYIALSEAKDMERNVTDFEPHSALFVPDEDPLLFYSRIVEIALSSLKSGGKLFLEINPRFSNELKNLLIEQGFENVNIVKDSSGKERFIECSYRISQ